MGPGTRRRTAISLAVLLGAAAGGAAAQDPAAPPAGKPAPTRWMIYPQAGGGTKPLPQLTPVTPPPAPVAPTVTYQKPAGGWLPTIPVAAEPVPEQQPPARPRPEAAQPDTPSDRDKEPEKPAGALPIDPNVPPDRAEVFRLDSDTALNRRMLRDLNKPATEKLPDKADTAIPESQRKYTPKILAYGYLPTKAIVEPNYLVHRRLYFEERNQERYGWDLGPLSALVATGYFYADTLFWPHNFAAGGFRERYDTSAGKCLPGDPVPFLFYPPGYTGLRPGGLAVETVIVTGLVFLFW